MTVHLTLLASGTLATLAGAAYVALAVGLGRRSMTRDAAAAWHAYRAWWWSVGSSLALTGLATLAAGVGVTSLPVFVFQAQLERALLAGGLWALMAYLTFVHTGHRRHWLPLAAFYASFYVLMVYQLNAHPPSAVVLQPWARPGLVFVTEPHPTRRLVILLQLFVPLIIAIVLHLRLRRRVSGAAARRIVLVVLGIFVWIVLSTVAYFESGNAALQLVNRSAGLAAAAVLYFGLRERRELDPREPGGVA